MLRTVVSAPYLVHSKPQYHHHIYQYRQYHEQKPTYREPVLFVSPLQVPYEEQQDSEKHYVRYEDDAPEYWHGLYLLSMRGKRSQGMCEADNCYMRSLGMCEAWNCCMYVCSRSPECSKWPAPLIADREVTCVWVLGSVAPVLAAHSTNTRTTNMDSTTTSTIITTHHVTTTSKMTKICVGISPSPSADKVPIKCRNVPKKCRRHYSETIFLHGF